MKRRIFHFILFAILLFFSVSCGIPNIYVPSSSDIVITPSTDKSGKFTVKFSKTLLNELSDGSPVLYFFYTISEESQSSKFSNALTLFNNEYSLETGGVNIPELAENQQPLISYKTGSGESEEVYGIFQFYNLKSCSLETSDNSEFSFVFSKDADYTLTLTDSDGTVIKSKITRYNEEEFKKTEYDKSTDKEIVDYTNTTYTVKVYLLVSCLFNQYSNIYNTELSSSSSVFEFTLDE